jgi:cation transport ATPase
MPRHPAPSSSRRAELQELPSVTRRVVGFRAVRTACLPAERMPHRRVATHRRCGTRDRRGTRPTPARQDGGMPRLLRIARRYWIVTLTIAIGLVGIVLAVSGAGAVVSWIFSAYALAIAAWQAVGMVRDILHGHWGLDILAVTAIVATVLVGEYVAALLVVLMLTGGEALEDYANRRAKRELDALLTRAPAARAPHGRRRDRRRARRRGAPG